jgi:S1-C subfamily serine protease
MRTVVLAALVVALTVTLTATIRAEDPGYIGVMIKKADGGIEVSGVGGDSPAEKAGVKMGDVIKKFNGDEVQCLPLEEFVKKVKATKPGDEIKLTVVRDGKEKEIKVKVGKVGG